MPQLEVMPELETPNSQPLEGAASPAAKRAKVDALAPVSSSSSQVAPAVAVDDELAGAKAETS